MITKIWTHKNVTQKGIVKSGGSVNTKEGIYSSLSHSCSIGSCKCAKGLWVAMNFGYDKRRKSVSGITFYFDNSIELAEFFRNVKNSG